MRQFGYTVVSDPSEGKQERDLFTCGHCQQIVTFAPGQMPEDAGGLCKPCGRLICKYCYGLQKCDVFEDKLARMEAKLAFLNSVGL